ncbi:MAG TPA: hypothetical protein VII92_19230 [Anaerolineae bacterium]
MIIRLIAVDPRPRKGKSDLLVYQVPENSREAELLIELLSNAGIEHALLEAPPRRTDK